jgi:hypothetical protein
VETKARSISFDAHKIHLVSFLGSLWFVPKLTGVTEKDDVSNENADKHTDGNDLDDKEYVCYKVA